MDVDIRIVFLDIDFVVFDYFVGYFLYVFIVWIDDDEISDFLLFYDVVLVVIEFFMFVFGDVNFEFEIKIK